ncbi:mitochondrial ribosomal protein [Colletotrichum simmondsii]|uniref:Mitochondrial ribosomal protein n=1 Tax=Colletotrichum simmondsii TaxID=703756 RepID=A0A135TG67_9PEZI|nr:mitochondrial ribosomal protein [Colletotrichum simmondsii]
MSYSFRPGSVGGRLLGSLTGRRDAARSPAHELRSSHAPELSPKSLYRIARSRFGIRQSNKAIDDVNVVHAGRVCEFRQRKAMAREGAMKDVKKLDFLTPLVMVVAQALGDVSATKENRANRASIAKSFKQILLSSHARAPPPPVAPLSPAPNPSHDPTRALFLASDPIDLSSTTPRTIQTSAKMGKLPTHLPRPTSLLSHRPSLTTSSCSGTTIFSASSPRIGSIQQSRAATFIPRPRRPYTFTQLIQLSDGSTYTVRTTSPSPLVRSAKDSRNHALWQPSDKSLKNVEVDEAGKLAAFRERFGRGFDLAAKKPTEEELNAAAVAAAATSAKDVAAGKGAAAAGKETAGKDAAAAAPAKETAKPAQPAATPEEDDIFDMGDLISGYAAMQPQQAAKEPPKKVAAPEKGKKGKK